MYKINDKVLWFKDDKILATGMIIGVKYTSPLGNIYKVDIEYEDDCKGRITKNIHENNLKPLE